MTTFARLYISRTTVDNGGIEAVCEHAEENLRQTLAAEGKRGIVAFRWWYERLAVQPGEPVIVGPDDAWTHLVVQGEHL